MKRVSEYELVDERDISKLIRSSRSARELVKRIGDHADSMGKHHIVVTMSTFTQIGEYNFSEELFSELYPALLRNINLLGMRSIQSVLQALSKSGSRHWMTYGTLCDRIICLLSEVEPSLDEMTMIAFVFAKGGYYREQLATIIMEFVGQKFSQFGITDSIRMLSFMAVFSISDNGLANDIINRLIGKIGNLDGKHPHGESFDKRIPGLMKSLATLGVSSEYVFVYLSTLIPSGAVLDEMSIRVVKAYAQYVLKSERVLNALSKISTSQSRPRKSIFDPVFAGIGIATTNFSCSDIEVRADSIVNDLGVAVIYCSAACFVSNSQIPIGSTVLNEQILNAMGYRVLQVPYWEWNELSNSHEKEEYLSRRVLEIVGY